MILATGQSVREYLVQQMAIGKYDPSIQSVREYLVQQVAMTDHDPGHWSVCER